MKHSNFSLSIIIPTFNRVKYLSETLASLASIKDLKEVIIVDDNSNDQTDTFIKDFKATHTLKYIKNSTNKGAPSCRNIGFEIASGTHILFLDSDDILNQDAFNQTLEVIRENPNYDYYYGLVLKTRGDLTINNTSIKVGSYWDGSPDSVLNYHWQTMGAIYERDFLNIVGPWNEKLKGSQDWEYQVRVKTTSSNGLFIDEIFGLWRDHNEERIGAKNYKSTYVVSVFKACMIIYDNISKKGILNKTLSKALARKMFFHILEASANKNSTLKQIGIKLNKSIINKSSYIYRTINFLLQFSISAIDGLIFKLITKRDIQ